MPAELVAMANNPLLFKVAVDAAHDNVAEKVYEVKQITADSKLVQEFVVFLTLVRLCKVHHSSKMIISECFKDLLFMILSGCGVVHILL